jgi:tetratricopeptide (TPR) repeat protein
MSKLMKGEEWFKHNMFTPPNSSEALRYFIYGKNARAKGDKSGAEKWYIKALDVDSNFTAAAFNLENIYAYDGKPEESLKWLVKDYEARGRMSYSDQIYASWAYACTFESPEKQIEYLNQWKEIDDQNLNSYWLLGLIYYTIEQYNKAIPELIKCSEISYNWYGKESYKDLSNYGYLGLAYHKTGQYKKEKKLWKFAERYIPENPWIITGKAVLAFSENDAVAAKKEIDRYISYGKKNSFTEADIASGVGDIYLNAGMVDKAETYYRKALSLDPGNTGKMNYLADFFIKTNRNLTEVPELMDKVMASAKNKVDYYRYLNKKGWAIYKQGKNQEALEILQRAWDEAPFKEFIIKSRLEEVKKAVAGGPSVKK